MSGMLGSCVMESLMLAIEREGADRYIFFNLN